MVEIKELYAQIYKKTLADDIKEHFKDEEIRNILLALIKGMSSPFTTNLLYQFQSNWQSHPMISLYHYQIL